MWLTELSDLPSYFCFGGMVGSYMGMLLQPPRVNTLANPIAPMMSNLSASCSIFASKLFASIPFLNLWASIQLTTLFIFSFGKLTSSSTFLAIFAPSIAWSSILPSSSMDLAIS